MRVHCFRIYISSLIEIIKNIFFFFIREKLIYKDVIISKKKKNCSLYARLRYFVTNILFIVIFLSTQLLCFPEDTDIFSSDISNYFSTWPKRWTSNRQEGWAGLRLQLLRSGVATGGTILTVSTIFPFSSSFGFRGQILIVLDDHFLKEKKSW